MNLLDDHTLSEIVKTARRIDYTTWWATMTSLGFCTNPITLHRHSTDGSITSIKIRCGNRKASICPSCSELYAGDMWQLIQTGLAGGKHGIPSTVATHPLLFLTLTAPSFGAGNTTTTITTNNNTSVEAWQPDDINSYDYIGHLLFTWHAPELWRRFTINLRREIAKLLQQQGLPPNLLRVNFLKIMEYQERLIPHYHAIIRVDHNARDNILPPQYNNSTSFMHAMHNAIAKTCIHVHDFQRTLQFGEQVDMKIITPSARTPDKETTSIGSPKVSSYLTKYVTKSITDLGLPSHKITAHNYALLDLTSHHKKLCETIAELSKHLDYKKITSYYHTLGYRGHITTKSRIYSTTLTNLREIRHQHQIMKNNNSIPPSTESTDTWEYHRTGHATIGERHLTYTAAIKSKTERALAREAKREEKELDHGLH